MDMRMSRYAWLHGIEMKTGLIGILACNRAYGPGMPAPGRTWEPVEGLKVTRCKINDVYIGLYGLGPRTRDFYIADNTLVAREWKNEYDSKWLHLYSEGGIDLSGQGHTVAHNAIDNFWDGSNWYTGSVGCDIYGNIVTDQKDNSFVMGSARNCRIFNNYWSGGGPVQNMNVGGGPVYGYRNVINGGGGFKALFGRVNGVLFYHNHFSRGTLGQGQGFGKVDLRNNVYSGGARMMLKTDFNVSVVDYNAYSAPAEGKEAKYQYGPARKKAKPKIAKTSEELIKATDTNRHSVFVCNWNQALEGHSPKLAEDSPLIDKGCLIPTINDDFKGEAPDIGMLEFDEHAPHYGPRKGGTQ